MLSIKDGIDGTSIANQVRLERCLHIGSFLLVEGSSDARLFKKFCDLSECSIIPCTGRDNLFDAINELTRDNVQGVLGFSDSDYSPFVGYPETAGDIVYTDENDLELMILCSGVLKNIIAQFGNPDSVKLLVEKEGKSIEELIFDSARVIGAVRLVARVKDWPMRFRDMKYRFKDKNSYIISQKLTIQHIYGRSQKDLEVREDTVRSLVQEVLDSNVDARELCCGHDCVRVLGRGLRKEFGKSLQFNNEAGAKILEGILRVAYDWDHFKETAAYCSIKVWEADNGYRILRSDK